MLIKYRAMSVEQKQVRRQAILDASMELFQSSSYDAVNIVGVAADKALSDRHAGTETGKDPECRFNRFLCAGAAERCLVCHQGLCAELLGGHRRGA
jgi:hypothetical protein